MIDTLLQKQLIIVVTGPTGVGKSALIRSLYNYPISIINADSRQVYRHMQIGTAAPEPKDLTSVPHHGFAFLSPNQKMSAGFFVEITKQAIQTAILNKRIPIIIGGSFFYIKALWDGLSPIPNISDEITQEINKMNLDDVRTKLLNVDIQASKSIDAKNDQRNRRALAVFYQTGKPFSQFQRTGGIWGKYHWLPICIEIDRETLYAKIHQRIENMFSIGFINEVKELLKLGYNQQSPGLNSIGYREVLAAFEQNISPKNEIIIQKINQNTRQFAKRQLTWFRNDNRLKRFDQPQAIFHLSHSIDNYL